jgi:hypothetical protein
MYRKVFSLCASAAIVMPLMIGIFPPRILAQERLTIHSRDGLPTGGGSPEAAACDMVRAMIGRSYSAFRESTPIVEPGSKTENDYVNHYVALVTHTRFRSKDGIATAHDLLSLQRMRLKLKKTSSPVAVDPLLINPVHGVLGTSTRHSFVDVTVADRKTGKEYTTRMMVMFRKKSGEWKAYPITHPNSPLFKAIDELGAAVATNTTQDCDSAK